MPAQAPTLHLIQQRIPRPMAVYAFGSRVQGTADADSDWDLAVLVEGYADPVLLWVTASELACETWPSAAPEARSSGP